MHGFFFLTWKSFYSLIYSIFSVKYVACFFWGNLSDAMHKPDKEVILYYHSWRLWIILVLFSCHDIKDHKLGDS